MYGEEEPMLHCYLQETSVKKVTDSQYKCQNKNAKTISLEPRLQPMLCFRSALASTLRWSARTSRSPALWRQQASDNKYSRHICLLPPWNRRNKLDFFLLYVLPNKWSNHKLEWQYWYTYMYRVLLFFSFQYTSGCSDLACRMWRLSNVEHVEQYRQ